MRRTLATSTLIATWLLVSLAPSAMAGGDPLEWLDRMTTAMSQMDYQGTFVYVQGDRMLSMRSVRTAYRNAWSR